MPTDAPLAEAGDAVADADELAAGALALVAVLVLVLVLELLPHPATINATPTSAATLPERTFAVVQIAICVTPSSWFSLDPSLERVIN